MKKEELRIGNLVEYPNWNKDGSVKYFHIRDVYTDDNKIGLTDGMFQVPSSKLKYIKPIHLTEEWLVKLGFVKDKLDNTYYKGDFEIYLPKYFKWKESIFRNVKTVHQLQNLYFALTGEELEVRS